MLSNTADHLFWMSRYTEQADKRLALAAQQRQPAQQAWGFLRFWNEEGAC
ncbi:MAG: alpha-E domain-containing protein [Comamonadaceae bacterium]|nr:alpha-E domain-containing protein [Comamonadaceae bacterium]